MQELAVILSRKFPGWLPRAVAIVASKLLESNNPDRELIWRLTTDQRMKKVWPQIDKLKGECRPISLTLAGNPRKKLGSVKHPQRQEENLVNIFAWAYVLARAPIRITTTSELDAILASCKNISKQLRKFAVTLRALPGRLPGSDRVEVEGIEHRLAESHAKKLEDTASFCDNNAATIKELKGSAGFNPQVVGRPGHRRHRRTRAYVRQLAAQTSEPLYGTIATIASVALDYSVSKEQVIDWTRGIDRPQNST